MAAEPNWSSKQERRVAKHSWRATTRRSSRGLKHVAEAIERYRTSELYVHDADEWIHRYHKATQELWKFCFRGGSGAYARTVAAKLEHLTAAGERPDWQAAAERQRG